MNELPITKINQDLVRDLVHKCLYYATWGPPSGMAWLAHEKTPKGWKEVAKITVKLLTDKHEQAMPRQKPFVGVVVHHLTREITESRK